MSVSLVAGTWKELLPFPTVQTAFQRAEASFSLLVSEAFNPGLLSEPGLAGGEGLQAPLAMGGSLPPSPGPCGRSLFFP